MFYLIRGQCTCLICPSIRPHRQILTEHFGDNLTEIWLLIWLAKWIPTSLFPTLPREIYLSLLPGLPPLQCVHSSGGHGKCGVLSWKMIYLMFMSFQCHITFEASAVHWVETWTLTGKSSCSLKILKLLWGLNKVPQAKPQVSFCRQTHIRGRTHVRGSSRVVSYPSW